MNIFSFIEICLYLSERVGYFLQIRPEVRLQFRKNEDSINLHLKRPMAGKDSILIPLLIKITMNSLSKRGLGVPLLVVLWWLILDDLDMMKA